jgi:hypothetical protein
MCYSILKLVAGAPASKGFAPRARFLWGVLKQLAPYAAIELILPGGTILAILLWYFRRRKAASHRMAVRDSSDAGKYTASPLPTRGWAGDAR